MSIYILHEIFKLHLLIISEKRKLKWGGVGYAPEGLSLSIQLLHLDQACVEHFISNLADGHVCTVGDDKRISCCRGANETNYFM